jgi:hypothetical protein
VPNGALAPHHFIPLLFQLLAIAKLHLVLMPCWHASTVWGILYLCAALLHIVIMSYYGTRGH